MTTSRRPFVLLASAAFVVACTSPAAEARKSARPSYAALKDRLDVQRRALAKRYRTARKPAARRGILFEARRLFESAVVDRLAPRWLGTDWAFAGTSETPRKGSIACGYFVSTLLRDAGLRVERAKLAQQASERIILSLTGEPHIQRFRRASLPRFLEGVYAQGDGLYVVGLDYHVGLLDVSGGRGRFIHSSNVGCPVRSEGCVIDEPAEKSLALEYSRYRVVGRISADDTLILKWLQGGAVPTR